MRIILTLILLSCSSVLLADRYDLPTDLIIESDCDIPPTPPPAPIRVDIVK